jgi:UDP-glucose 4-epimerase
VADIRDQAAAEKLVRGCDVIFNMAGQVSHIDSVKDPYQDLEINCRAQLSLLEACRRRNPGAKVLFAGTRQVYGIPSAPSVDEKHPLRPMDINGIHKMAGEYYHLLYHRLYGLRAVSLRLTNTYGPRQLMKHNRQGFIAWFVRKAVEGGTISLYGGGGQRRDLNHVEDVVDAFLLAAVHDRADGQVYNLGAPRSVSLRAIAETLVRLSGRGSVTRAPFPPDHKRIDIGSYHADTAKIRRELGWTPRIPLEQGLRETVAFYQAHRGRYW